jgi:hypothetical protein
MSQSTEVSCKAGSWGASAGLKRLRETLYASGGWRVQWKMKRFSTDLRAIREPRPKLQFDSIALLRRLPALHAPPGFDFRRTGTPTDRVVPWTILQARDSFTRQRILTSALLLAIVVPELTKTNSPLGSFPVCTLCESQCVDFPRCTTGNANSRSPNPGCLSAYKKLSGPFGLKSYDSRAVFQDTLRGLREVGD